MLAGFLFSCIIEVNQLLTQWQFCQLDIAVINIVGLFFVGRYRVMRTVL